VDVQKCHTHNNGIIKNLLARVTDRIRFFLSTIQVKGWGRAHGSGCVCAPHGHNGQPERTGPPPVCRSPPRLHFPAGAALGARTVPVASSSRPHGTLPPSHPMVFQHGMTGTARGLCGERTRSPSSSCTGSGPASVTPPRSHRHGSLKHTQACIASSGPFPPLLEESFCPSFWYPQA
jgi:hypothetical protein